MEGWGAALDWARKIQDSVIEAERQNWFEQGRQAAFREVAKTSIFRFIDQGRQVVQVGRYAYAWAGREPLEIGDRVLLPGNWLYPKPSEDTVTGQGTSYTGTLSEIIRKI
jgi:hypothetical protein